MAKKTKSDLSKIDSMSDKDIDYSDIPATSAEHWKNARVRRPGEKKPSDDPTAAPQSEVEVRVWAILETSKQKTKGIIKREREGELVSPDLLMSLLRACR